MVINVYDRTFNLHRGGKISIASKIPLKSLADLAMAYTPGVGRICRDRQDPEQVHNLIIKQTPLPLSLTAALFWMGKSCAAALPVMEGKAMLFKEFRD